MTYYPYYYRLDIEKDWRYFSEVNTHVCTELEYYRNNAESRLTSKM
jgi:hypothetical protein